MDRAVQLAARLAVMFGAEPTDKDIDKTPGAGLPVWMGFVIGKANLRPQKVNGLDIVPDRSVGDGALHKQGLGLRPARPSWMW